jgi:hypothetical protein
MLYWILVEILTVDYERVCEKLNVSLFCFFFLEIEKSYLKYISKFRRITYIVFRSFISTSNLIFHFLHEIEMVQTFSGSFTKSLNLPLNVGIELNMSGNGILSVNSKM